MQREVKKESAGSVRSSAMDRVRMRIKVSKKPRHLDAKSPSFLFKFLKPVHAPSKCKNCTDSENTFPETQTHAAHMRTTSDQIRPNEKAAKSTKFNSGIISQVMQKCRLSPPRVELVPSESSSTEEKGVISNPIACPSHIIKREYFVITKQKNNSRKSNYCSFCSERKLRGLIYLQLYNKYEASTQNIYNVNMVNDIISSADTQLMVNFKESLLYDDTTEFLKAFYSRNTIFTQLESAANLHLNLRRAIPNFAALKEKQYILKNIARKEKLLKVRREQANNEERIPEIKLFTKKFLEEITVHCSQSRVRNSLENLLNDFIDKDSLSLIQKTELEATKKKPVVIKGSNLNGLKANLLKKNAYRRHESQKEVRDGKPISGRMTSTENYLSKLSFKEVASPKKLVLSNSKPSEHNRKRRGIAGGAKGRTALSKGKQRSETPQSCTAYKFHGKEKRCCEGSEYQLDRPVFSSYGKREESEGSARSLMKHRENVSADKKLKLHKKETNSASAKLMKYKAKGMVQQEKKPVLKHLCKSIKDLLAPVGSGSRVKSPENEAGKHKPDKKKKGIVAKERMCKCSSLEKELLKVGAVKKKWY
eukprot:TRINITY_DN8355_c0_g1_i1.p1 TRINITY_DN8355_c0_g1~~TRINITY_DN8355_c0_g1_i1.p1  ORF type:complete len:592 (+),score=158.29 TRINITY_DN8355_c0_g1_i1:185-1960(+)